MFKALRLSEVVGPLNARVIGADVAFRAVSSDSRAIQPGQLFVALAGPRFDGHDWLAQAHARKLKQPDLVGRLLASRGVQLDEAELFLNPTLKDLFPDARLMLYCEFFYRADGSDVGFDPERPVTLSARKLTSLSQTTRLPPNIETVCTLSRKRFKAASTSPMLAAKPLTVSWANSSVRSAVRPAKRSAPIRPTR